MTKAIGAFLILAATLLARGDPAPPQDSPEIATHDQTVSFKASVNIVTVPVVVRDAKGRPVADLTKDDFRIFDRGKLQVISRFTIERPETEKTRARANVAADTGGRDNARILEPGVPEAVLPDRFLAYLFDDVHSSTGDLTMARDAANRQIKTVLNAKTRLAVFTTSGQTMLDFTDDRDKLQAALLSLQPHPVAASQGSRDCPDLTYPWADRIRNQNDEEALRWALAEAYGCSHAGGAASALVRAAVARVIAGTEQSSTVALDVLKGAVHRLSVMPGQRVLVLVSPGFLTMSATREAETNIIDRAIQANVIVNSLDARGLAAEAKDASRASLEMSMGAQISAYTAYRERVDHEVFTARSDVLAEIAYGTGGTFYHNSNDLDAGFQRAAGAPDCVYILGFSPPDLKMDGSTHPLRVTLTPNPRHLDLEARRSYSAPKALDDPAEAAKQEITQAVFSRDEVPNIPLRLQTEYFKTAGLATVTVVTKVDLKALPLRKSEGRRIDTLTITTAMFDSNGNYAAAIQRGVELRLKEESLDKWLSQGIMVPSKLEVKPGTYLIRVVVRDSEGQLLAARNGSVDIR